MSGDIDPATLQAQRGKFEVVVAQIDSPEEEDLALIVSEQ